LSETDEENMRSWSHHFNVDTCDDPVFRAAMQGYDQVSFVFGLEVTWSLIQQRQQEEEEKIAMEELQRVSLEELTCGLEGDRAQNRKALEENKNNDYSVVPETTSSIVEEDDEEWTLEKIFDQLEIEKGYVKCSSSRTCQLNACSLWVSNLGGKCHTCFGCQESQFGGWPKGLEPSDQLLVCIQKYCTALFLEMTRDESATKGHDANVEFSH
jgi:hypothetical protein